MGKASRRKDVVDVIKEQSRKEKRDAGLRRSNATGISSAALSVIGPAHTLGEGAGHTVTGGGDLNMHTYDIVDLDRLLFSTSRGTEDPLVSTDTGIEADAFYDETNNLQYSFGMKFQVPQTTEGGDPIVAGIGYRFRIGSGFIPFEITINSFGGATASIRSSSTKPSGLEFLGAATTPSNAYDGSPIIYSDGTDIFAQVAAGVVNLTSGSSGASTALDNLTDPTAINQDLLPDSDAGQDLGANGTAWGTLYTDSIRLYSSTASAPPAKTHQGYIRLYIGNTHRWIPYYS